MNEWLNLYVVDFSSLTEAVHSKHFIDSIEVNTDGLWLVSLVVDSIIFTSELCTEAVHSKHFIDFYQQVIIFTYVELN